MDIKEEKKTLFEFLTAVKEAKKLNEKAVELANRFSPDTDKLSVVSMTIEELSLRWNLSFESFELSEKN